LCRSSLEVFYANHLIKNNIKFEYEKVFSLSNNRHYTPDFYLVKEDRYVDPKGEVGVQRKEQFENMEVFRKDYNAVLDILYWKDIIEICELPRKSWSVYRDKANKMKIKVEDFLAEGMYYAAFFKKR